jgi:hypothetical protein
MTAEAEILYHVGDINRFRKMPRRKREPNSAVRFLKPQCNVCLKCKTALEGTPVRGKQPHLARSEHREV